jgi:hypothetical protein
VTWWLRPFLFLDLHLSPLARFARMLRDELLWALVPESKRARINEWIYRRDPRYRPGGEFFEGGLFDWEKKIFAHPEFPRNGTILLGGAGAGRELVALSRLGYGVIGFEPVEDLLETARSVAANLPGVELHPGGYADLADFPIDKLQIDAVVLGWGSFSNLLTQPARIGLLTSIRTRAPRAPLLLSVLPESTLPSGRIERIRRMIRSALRFVGLTPASPGNTFLSTAGFAHLFTPEEITDLAARTGYEVIAGDWLPYPHALLRPR